jgi:exodeoxyribonuclease V beta subunit
MQNLNPMTMPLTGANLIEASAGTGKTYTITALYLRLILGFNQVDKKSEPLSIENILVVTFTEAATAEIKDRVRNRLMTLRDRLLGDDTNDEVVNELYDLIEDKHKAFNLIDSAVKSLDDAAIFTIHGFCLRMLQKHAFESGMGFDLTFVMDQVELLDTAIKDFWRKTVFPLDKISYAAVTQCFKSPQQLLKGLYGLLVRQGAIITPQYSLKQALTLQQQLKQAADILKQAIIEQHFIGFVQSSPFNKKKSIASAKKPRTSHILL